MRRSLRPRIFGVVEEAAPRHQVQSLSIQQLHGLAHGGRFVLAIAVHHHSGGIEGCDQAFLDGAGQSGASHPLDDPDPWVLAGQGANQIWGAIAGIVIDDQDFERMIRPQVKQGFDHLADGTTFIECGQHDGQAAVACRSFTFRGGRHSALQSGSGYRQLARVHRPAWPSVMQSFCGLSLRRRPGPPLKR